MEKKEKNSVDQQKKNKLVIKAIVVILAVIIILLLLRSCTKRTPLTITLSENWFYSDNVAADVVENIVSVEEYTLNHDGEMYISDSNSVVYREGGYEFEFVAEYGDVIIAVTDGNNSGQADCLVMKGVEWYLTDNKGEDAVTITELYYSGTTSSPVDTGDGAGDDNTPSAPTTPSNPTDDEGGESGSGDSDQPASKPEQVELGGSLGSDHQVVVGGSDQPSGDTGTGNGGSNNGSTGGSNGGAIVIIPDKDVTGTIPGEDNIANNPGLSHDSTSIGDRVTSKPADTTPVPVAPADNGGSNNTSTDAGKPADGGASKPAPAPTPQPQPENPPVVVEAPAPADNNSAPADNTPASSTDPSIVCDENGDCKIVW